MYRNSKTAQTGLSGFTELRAVALFNGLRIGQPQTRCTCIRAKQAQVPLPAPEPLEPSAQALFACLSQLSLAAHRLWALGH